MLISIFQKPSQFLLRKVVQDQTLKKTSCNWITSTLNQSLNLSNRPSTPPSVASPCLSSFSTRCQSSTMTTLNLRPIAWITPSKLNSSGREGKHQKRTKSLIIWSLWESQCTRAILSGSSSMILATKAIFKDKMREILRKRRDRSRLWERSRKRIAKGLVLDLLRKISQKKKFRRCKKMLKCLMKMMQSIKSLSKSQCHFIILIRSHNKILLWCQNLCQNFLSQRTLNLQ